MDVRNLGKYTNQIMKRSEKMEEIKTKGCIMLVSKPPAILSAINNNYLTDVF